MRFDTITEPVSAEDPCGPDLDEEGDDSYLNYVLSAAGRIPESFYQRDMNSPVNDVRLVPFDRTTIDLKSEVKSIAALLARTRDLRLLTLEARFQCLAGQVVGFCECLRGMAMLVTERWDCVHPRGSGDDFTMRQNTLAGLEDQASILLPLTYASLAVSKKVGGVSLRDHQVATGVVRPRAGERQIDASDIAEPFQNPENRMVVTGLEGAVRDGIAALGAISGKFADAAGYEYRPDFTNLLKSLGDIRDLIHGALPELAAAAEAEERTAAAPDEAVTGAEVSFTPAFAATAEAIVLPDHAAASAALLAVEQYFARIEPSSPILILIHQARMLVGKSLVEAMELLMPEGAVKAGISFAGGPPVRLSMPKMKEITQSACDGIEPVTGTSRAVSYSAATRQEAEQLIGSVDAFFRACEPSSPIPMLIGRARTFMNRDFAAILSEILKNDAAPVP